ncbi:MAG TPA: alpha/beta hydrolase [Verrucomicrobiae bacterium]|nr:alpha/beta hydrolase [Verrucomicrobiae bacterium]
MNVVVDNLLTTYEQAGKGPAVLLLHGWGDSQATFAQLAKKLQTTHTTIVVDLPGFGGTQPPQETWGVGDYVHFVSQFLKKIDAPKLQGIVGHSNGGTIAIKGLATGELKADILVLLASAGIRDVYRGRKKMLRLAAKTAKLATAPLPKSVQTRLKKKAYKAIGSDLFVAEHLQETFKKIVTDDVQTEAATLKLPTLLIYGSEDTATPVTYGELFHVAIAGSKLQVLPGAGHFVHHDRLDEVYELVKGFLK